MSEASGAFFAIEGSDGAGKATQVQLLKKRLESLGYEVELLAFPRYDQPSSHFVRQYLKGAYGSATTVNPYTAALFYALDRYEAAPLIKQSLADGKIVLADRYTGSNMAHQGSKFINPAERRGFFVWAESTEYQLLGIPRPNLNIFLRVPAEISAQLLSGRQTKDSSSSSQDQHEGNLEHLKSAVETYDMLCQLFAVDYKSIDCVQDEKLMDRQAIHSRVWRAIEPLLPAVKKTLVAQPTRSSEPVKKNGQDKVKKIHDTDGSLKWSIDGISLIAAFGLQQAGLSVQLDYDNYWAGPGTSYKFAYPEGINDETRSSYKKIYNRAAELHQKLYEKLDESNEGRKKQLSEQFKLAVPMGAIFSAKVEVAKSQAITVIEKLRTHPNHEIMTLQDSLSFVLDHKIAGHSHTKSAESSPQPINDILDKISIGKPDYGADLEPLKIIEFNPRNEFELIADSIYPQSSLTREEIMLALDRLTYDQKVGELQKALSVAGVLQLLVYRFDVLTDWLTLAAVLSSKTAEIMNMQQLTTRYGYDVPQGIEAANLEDPFMEIFDSYLGLYSQLQREYDDNVTQYATLAGNKIRWQAKITAEALKDVNRQNQASINPFYGLLLSKIQEVHPLIAVQLAPAPKKVVARRRRKSSSRKKS